MGKRTLLIYLGAALLASVSPAVYSAAHPPAAQTTSKTSASKSKKRKKTAAKPKGQKTPTADRIREIQTALQKDGSYQGEPNGKWDDATVEAMKKFQDKNGLRKNRRAHAEQTRPRFRNRR
jgi:peptidoglycan hydrolase-like protein with peptidoglycan-binding domain